MTTLSRRSFFGAAAGLIATAAIGTALPGAASADEQASSPEYTWTDEPVEFESAGLTLRGVIHRPDLAEGEKCPMLLCFHGLGGSVATSVAQTLVAEKLAALGVASIQFDFDGHGESDGEFADHNVLKEVEDGRVVYEYAATLDWVDTTKIGIIGHSQGGMVTDLLSADLGAEKVPFIILEAPAMMGEDCATTGIWPTRDDLFDARVEHDSDDLIDLTGVNGFGMFAKYQYYEALLETDLFGDAASYEGNVLLIWGTDDAMVPVQYIARTGEAYRNVEICLLEGDDHSFTLRTEDFANKVVEFVLRQVA